MNTCSILPNNQNYNGLINRRTVYARYIDGIESDENRIGAEALQRKVGRGGNLTWHLGKEVLVYSSQETPE